MGTGLPTPESLHASCMQNSTCYVYIFHVWSKDFSPIPPIGQVMCEVSEWYRASLAQVSGQIKLCSQKPEFVILILLMYSTSADIIHDCRLG